MGIKEKRKALVFVPHQDDEINLIGNCIKTINDYYEIAIVYSSIDRNEKQAKMRKSEAYSACAELGINTQNIIFLDFPDSPNINGDHYFNHERSGVISRLVELIEEYMPDLIVGTDFDYHSDHRMLSIALDFSVGIVVKRHNQNYCPLYLKGFCYETAFCGVNDYFSSRYGPTIVSNEVLSNPSFEWEKRVSITENCREQHLLKNKTFRALCKHKSQYAALRAAAVINSDNVFWVKRTDNLLLDANVKIETSSGNQDKLNDFVVLDSDDIIPTDPRRLDYSQSLWIPSNDHSKHTITITFENDHSIDCLVIHGNIQKSDRVKVNGTVSINGRMFAVQELQPYARDTVVVIGGLITKRIEIVFNGDVEISEIEIFDLSRVKIEGNLFEKRETCINRKFLFSCQRILFSFICIWLKVHRRMRNIINH